MKLLDIDLNYRICLLSVLMNNDLVFLLPIMLRSVGVLLQVSFYRILTNPIEF